ncbi:ArsR/SmtB family transcription factor [Halomonas organivorans]|uniref:DNA-binding transcriptional ArsR family regulator n=1 Tax=Halomonas organivorans TaxID=257772 RepID=A0A7W5C0I0_9GAMM|nr:helix-turn-helix domain-containing protein [Halomonas organivorans]MBB3142381.1 DNA-binding transcriptional ArsR family regulator [Halomonas organivorans]
MAVTDLAMSRVAAAIAEPARARMLCALMDGHARTSTELAAIAEVGPPTASAHLARLAELALVRRYPQGRHRYYALEDPRVAEALEGLMVIGQSDSASFAPNTPRRLCFARTCYDHMAGELAVALHDACLGAGWLIPAAEAVSDYRLSEEGERVFHDMGVDVRAVRARRRRFARPCMDWSMRRPHLAGALGAALLDHAIGRAWVRRELDGRALRLTSTGRRALERRFDIQLPD